ncbi:MAG: sulfatase [Planctomycetes bacterium]|nr:sulfatase [Planctomycetota bacterium]
MTLAKNGGIAILTLNNYHTELAESSAGLEMITKRKSDKGVLYVLLDVTDKSFTLGKAPQVELAFDYYDEGKGQLVVKVDSHDPLYGNSKSPGTWKGVGGVQFTNSHKWKRAKIAISDASFSNRLNGGDIRLQMQHQPLLKLRNVTIKKKLPISESIVSSGLKKKPNILCIVVDDLNDYIGPYDDNNAKTPHLDKLFASGMRFNKAYCQYPVCGPSRASFLTGMYPENIGVLSNEKHARSESPNVLNMLEYFKKKGYWTASAGKIFHGETNVVEAGVSTHRSDWFENSENVLKKKLQKLFEKQHGPISKNKNEWQKYLSDNYVSPERVVQAIPTDLKEDEHMDGRVAARISSYLKQKTIKDSPFLLACGFTKPHVPFYAPKKYFDLYSEENLNFEKVPPSDWAQKPKTAIYDRYKGFGAKFGEYQPELRRKWLHAYLACVSFVDAQIGKVLSSLEENGLADNTIVVLISDHGFHIGEHFHYGKVTLFEESARVPMFLRVPGMDLKGQESNSLTELLDIYPTLVELCNLEAPKHLEGKSLLPILKNPNASVKESAYTVVTRPLKGRTIVAKAIRYKNWRYAEWDGPADAELYNLNTDPKEYRNLIKDPEFAPIVKKLHGMIQARSQ